MMSMLLHHCAAENGIYRQILHALSDTNHSSSSVPLGGLDGWILPLVLDLIIIGTAVHTCKGE
jgi:hypothetical protein